MKSILVVYYTQTGQLKKIIDSVISPLQSDPDIAIDYLKIEPETDWAYPWNYDDFFQVFPESVQGIPCPLKVVTFEQKEYDMVILAYQVWYLSPSMPFNSFLLMPETKAFLKGKNVITLLGIRNMWVGAQEKVKILLNEAGANLIGNIVLKDMAHNLISVVTIIRWLIKGNKGPYKKLPEAGVPEKEILGASKYGKTILEHLEKESDKMQLQNELLNQGAVQINYQVMKMEQNGARIFKIFSKFVLAKGAYGEMSRIKRLRFFKGYLLFIIFVISPIAECIIFFGKFLFWPLVKREIEYYKGIRLKENTGSE